jgi:hypothetical protein
MIAVPMKKGMQYSQLEKLMIPVTPDAGVRLTPASTRMIEEKPEKTLVIHDETGNQHPAMRNYGTITGLPDRTFRGRKLPCPGRSGIARNG